MANEAAQDSSVSDKAQVSSSAMNEEELKPLRDAVRPLPVFAVKDLVSADVCSLCILRLFGLHEHICSRPSVSALELGAIFHQVLELGGDKVDNCSTGEHEDLNGQQHCIESTKQNICPVCLGIMQFLYLDDDRVLVKKECARDLVVTIAEAVKREGHEADSFSLEVSLPALVMEKENTLWSYMKHKYSSELWYQELCLSERVSAKDVLKMSITGALETLLGVKSNLSSFRIRLTYTEASVAGRDLKGNNGCNKRRKTESSDSHEAERNEASKTCSEVKVQGLDSLKFQLDKVSQPCCLEHLCYRTSIYVGGRYLKYSRNVSQTRWVIDDERMGEASVEEIIGDNILPMCRGDNYKFHAAGREDIDVRMLGTGRPFLVEIQNARQVPSEVLMKDVELKINNLESKLIRVKNLQSLGNKGWDLMREGEAEKQKQYAALVWISRPLKDDDLQSISSLKDMKILQKTPIRVLHRRSPLEREKIIHWMRVESVAGSSQYLLLHLCTQAGTYIKEFVHGDLGRTHPSVGSILECRAEILQLDVTDVKMDCFQDECT